MSHNTPRGSGNESRIGKHSETIWVAVGALAFALGIAIAVMSSGGAAAEVANESVTINDSDTEYVWVDVEASNDTSLTVELVDDTGTAVNSTTLNATAGNTSSTEFYPTANGSYTVTVDGTTADVISTSVGVETESGGGSGSAGFFEGSNGKLAAQAIIALVLAAAAVVVVDAYKED